MIFPRELFSALRNTRYSEEGTNLFQNASSGDVAGNVTFLISNYARALCDRAGRESWVSIIARPEIKTQSRRLAEFRRRAFRVAPKVCRKAKHLRQMFRRVQMLLNSSRLQLGNVPVRAWARFISRLMNLRNAR